MVFLTARCRERNLSVLCKQQRTSVYTAKVIGRQVAVESRTRWLNQEVLSLSGSTWGQSSQWPGTLSGPSVPNGKEWRELLTVALLDHSFIQWIPCVFIKHHWLLHGCDVILSPSHELHRLCPGPFYKYTLSQITESPVGEVLKQDRFFSSGKTQDITTDMGPGIHIWDKKVETQEQLKS